MKSRILHQLILLFVSSLSGIGLSFVPPSSSSLHYQSRYFTDDNAIYTTTSSLLMAEDNNRLPSPYPVINRIAGKNWTGTCKYINSDLIHLSKLKLSGGVRYDIDGQNNITLSSYLTFPNGKTREVVMTGSKDDSSNNVIILNPIEEGPIQMILSEIAPDTILVNEVEIASGKIIMTCSTSIVHGVYGDMELVQISHEVGGGGGEDNTTIEGHQVWTLKQQEAKLFDVDAPLEVP